MLLDISYRLRNLLLLSKTTDLNSQLLNKKKEQIKKFDKLKKIFPAKYKKIKRGNEEKYIIRTWVEKNKELERRFLPHPPFGFLRNPIVMRTMFVAKGGKWLIDQLNYLESKISKKKLSRLLEEDLVGGPLLSNAKYLTSHNSIHHVYHLLRFTNRTNYKFRNNQTIVEWGGGYGNFAKILRRYNAKLNITYIIIDTSIFTCLQWLYLSTVFGEDQVFLITSKYEKIKKRKINILPLAFLKYNSIKADLFVSTWALSESSKYSQKYVISSNWFQAKSILLAFQKSSESFPFADNLSRTLKERGGNIEEIPFLPNNYYGYFDSAQVTRKSI